ncbi:kek1, putative [Pediculus humanus corporis]|uniref:Kek1, putative n=1 Tax=Pediculus humanus subsp. corporis TaxID=121224 RepID=E0VWH6_PEDHC|nr:kek1, putative [Pediculus humanus corporis]EEB17732.1 kek1, putative [Pediculus humanus corporis]
MRLIVSGNPIRALQTASFRPLSFLTSLELSNCQIESIEDGTFLGLDNLEWLKLDGNRLNFIRGENILPDAVHGVALDRNPWQCDCRLLEVHNWLLNYKIIHSTEPKCAAKMDAGWIRYQKILEKFFVVCYETR